MSENIVYQNKILELLLKNFFVIKCCNMYQKQKFINQIIFLHNGQL